MSPENIILTRAEHDFAEFDKQREALWKSTQEALLEYRQIAQNAQAAIMRLENQLEKLAAAKESLQS